MNVIMKKKKTLFDKYTLFSWNSMHNQPEINHGKLEIGDRALVSMSDTCVFALFKNIPSMILKVC